MTEPRIIQNFLGYRAFVVSEAPADITQLDASLAKLGLTVSHPIVEGGLARLGEEVLASDQSVLFIDADLNLAVEGLGQERLPRIPVIGLIGVEAPSRLKAIMRLGATATLRKPIYGGSVYSTLFVGINAFRQRRAMALDIEEHERRRSGRRYLMKAIVAVMKAVDCDEDAAYDRLRRESMRQRLSVEDYCEQFMRALPGAYEQAVQEQGTTNPEKTKQGGK